MLRSVGMLVALVLGIGQLASSEEARRRADPFQLKLENRFIRVAVWSSGKAQRYIPVPDAGVQTVNYPRVAHQRIEQLRSSLRQESFLDLPTSFGKAKNPRENVFVIEYIGSAGRHRVEIVDLKDQPDGDEVSRFRKIWDTAFAGCFPSVKIKEYEHATSTYCIPIASAPRGFGNGLAQIFD